MSFKDATLTVVGVGGSGCNAIKYMSTKDSLDEGIKLIAINTDNQSLDSVDSNITRIQIGTDITKGRGAGADPEIGRLSAEEDFELIKEYLESSDMVFITTGMGGGTGTGAAPVIARIAKELGILVVAIATLPFNFEGNKKKSIALDGVSELEQYVDSIIIVPNQKLFDVFSDGSIQLNDAFERSNDILLNAVQGISDIIVRSGMINIDFNDVKTVMSDSGNSMMGVGYSTPEDEDKAKAATIRAVDCPLLEINSLKGASGIIVNITSDGTLKLDELQYIGDIIKGSADDDATIIVGTSVDQSLNGEIKVTIIATNLTKENNDSEYIGLGITGLKDNKIKSRNLNSKLSDSSFESSGLRVQSDRYEEPEPENSLDIIKELIRNKNDNNNNVFDKIDNVVGNNSEKRVQPLDIGTLNGLHTESSADKDELDGFTDRDKDAGGRSGKSGGLFSRLFKK